MPFNLKSVALLFVLVFASISVMVPVAEAQTFGLRGLESWYWTGSTQVNSLCLDDVLDDERSEMITGGWYTDGVRDRAQLAVWKRVSSTITLEAIEDAYVNASNPETNYGDTSFTYVSANSELDFIYTKFDLTSIPSDANIVSAKLKVYFSNVGGNIYWDPADKIGAYYCSDNSWTESGINWNNKPIFSSIPTDTWAFKTITHASEYKSWDITADVKTAVSSGIITEVLKFASKTGDGYAYFLSREGLGMGGEPKLTVEYFTLLDNAQTLQSVADWYWIGNTRIESVCSADLDEDDQIEVVTGGYFNDGTRDVAQLVVWNGASLAMENVRTWYWTSDTAISSVAVGDVDADGQMEVVTGGSYFDGYRWVAQLCVWDGATLAFENVQTWYWTSDTEINSVVVSDVDDDGAVEVATGGYFNDGTRDVAQLVVWNGASLAMENVRTWYWTSDTAISSVAVGDVDADGGVEVVTGGYFNDGTRDVAQLVVWNGASLSLKSFKTWHWIGDTTLQSVAVGDLDGDGFVEIITGGSANQYAQLCAWNGSNLALKDTETWQWGSDAWINSVAIGDVDGDNPKEIATGGHYYDGTHNNAQLTVWGTT